MKSLKKKKKKKKKKNSYDANAARFTHLMFRFSANLSSFLKSIVKFQLLQHNQGKFSFGH